MSLTGCPPLPQATARERVAERVELMALLWQVLDGDTAYCANPRLLMVTKIVPELLEDSATTQLAALRETQGRDSIIKGLTADVHGSGADPAVHELAEALDSLSDRWDGLLQALAIPLHKAYRDMCQRAGQLVEGFDPAGDLQSLTGERDALTVAILPSLFLPPPQNGRHSSLVVSPDGAATGYLFYGFPLDNDPARFGINSSWLLGGAWHYAVTRFIERRWPALGKALQADPGLEAALTAALAAHRAQVAWPQCIAEHLTIALKCALCRQAGLADLIHRIFAKAQGAAFFDWFAEWTTELARDPESFVREFERLPEILAARQGELIETADATRSGPASINFALSSRQDRVLVVPDHWSEELSERIRRRWSLVSRAFERESTWRERSGPQDVCVIAFGQAGRDRLIDSLLDARGLTLDRSDDGGDVLVSLSPPDRALKPWQLAVAVHDPEVAGNFAAEHVMGLFHRTARFSDYQLVEGDGMTVEFA
ncbi:hypothetical protein [Novosphingobium beihaiensis]|uniref:Uncharacterized protein n=1 Tax=Novosphingobium beihaiensis TaxID=2930389 RepID=A0ABT0BTU2_9SPHN|nr:hypothetical protein [Novosphingobium beihaiensis]MCJ2188481.1 hypothetical protein [Novosphingobium beihaiensis]